MGVLDHGACRGAQPLCVSSYSPKIGGTRGLKQGNPARWDDDENNPAFVEGDYQG